MVRVFRRPASALERHAPGRVAKRAARKHRVILESVTREKKKLRSVISFEAKAPPGYTFIPAGNPQLTSACKELCRKDGQKVYAVTTTPHMHTHNLSQHVHRIGYHFPSAVVATVCMDLGLHLTAAGNVMPAHINATASKLKRANSEVSQITINTEARDVLRDLFPNIPDNDLNQIIKTAFQKGQRKVGTAAELPLARRAQLAVVAHIRHIYTDYDRLLKTTSFHEARSLVEEPTLAKLVEWRGDDENGKTVLEDIFREVIVISDDDDDDDSDTEEGGPLHSTNRDRSVEVISSHPRVEELQARPVNYAHSRMREAQLDISDDEAPPGFRFIPEVPKKSRVDRRGFSRYHAWDRAINRYRNGAGQRRLYNDFTGQRESSFAVPQPAQESIRVGMGPTSLQKSTATRHASVGPHAASNSAIPVHTRQRVFLHPVAEDCVSSQETVPNSHQKPNFMNVRNTQIRPMLNHRGPSNIRSPVELSLQRSDPALLPNGSLTEQVPMYHPREHLDRGADDLNIPVFVGGPREPQGRTKFPPGTSPRIPGLAYGKSQANPPDRVLPSIETPPSPEDTRRPIDGHLDQFTRRMTGGFTPGSVTPYHLAPQDSLHQEIVDNAQGPATKRRRVAVYQPAYEPVDHVVSRSAVASAVFEDPQARQQYVSLGYAPSGLMSSPNEHSVRRRYMVPVKSSHPADHYPEKMSSASDYTTGFQPIPEASGSQRRYANFEGNLSSRGHNLMHHFEYSPRHRSPEPHALSGPFYATPANEKPGNATPFHHPASRIEATYDGNRIYQGGAEQMPQVSNPQPILRRNQLYQHNTGAPRILKRSIYADDFIRPVDLNDDVRVANHPRRAHFQTSQPPESGSRMTSALYQYPSERESGDVSMDMLPGSHTGQFVSRARINHVADDHVLMNDETSYYNRSDVHNSTAAVGQRDRRGEPQLQPLRFTQEDRLHTTQVDAQRQPAYIRRIGVSRPRHALPKGRTVVIVD